MTSVQDKFEIFELMHNYIYPSTVTTMNNLPTTLLPMEHMKVHGERHKVKKPLLEQSAIGIAQV
jgi:hypothetical protein